MTVVASQRPGAVKPLRAGVDGLLAWKDAIASLSLDAWKWAGLIALFATLLDCTLLVGSRRPSVATAPLIPVCIADALGWAVQVTLGLCAWAIADRSAVRAERRVWRLAVALGVVILLQAVLVSAVVGLLVERPDPCAVMGYECDGRDWSKVPWWLRTVDDSGQMLIFGALVFAWLEMNRRNRETEEHLLATQQERARLVRSALDARLTAMRAQVDPQFLFESLADVDRAYAVDNTRGAGLLDRLIAYLRTALPRLRAGGSTVGSEAELVDAWLAVVAARRNGALTWNVDVDARCAAASFPATVLLPLVQCALGGVDRPQLVALSVMPAPDAGARRLTARLRLAPGCPCRDDEPEPQRIRSRMQAVYGELATLSCVREAAPSADGRGGDGATVITLQWPDEGAERDRR